MTVPDIADGDGWVDCALGHRHWGRNGAAGLLLYRGMGESSDTREVLLQHRAEWSHHGGTWGVLGGARHSTEQAVDAALREAYEEAALSGTLTYDGQHDDDHGTWTYSTIVGQAGHELVASAAGGESLQVTWWRADDVQDLSLHPGFALTWPLLREALQPWHVVVDAANVIGARPDGWWRDRAAAAGRLIERCAVLARTGLARAELHDVRPDEVLHRRWPRWTIVLEGAARSADIASREHLRVVAAPGSGDDAVVDEVRSHGGAATLVVTADRDLQRRSRAAGGTTVGPHWLLDRLPLGG